MSSKKVKIKGPDLNLIVEQHKKGFRKDYDIFLSKLGDPSLPVNDLLLYIKAVKNCIHLLDKEYEMLVGVMLKIDWPSLPGRIVQEYQEFLLNLVSAHTFYLRAILRMLVKRFLVKMPEDLSNLEKTYVDLSVTQKHDEAFVSVHLILKAIAKIVPMMPTTLMPLLCDCFPYVTKETYLQECYVKNLLQITYYIPTLRQNILELIVDRMIKLDVRSPRHVIQEAEADDNDNEMDTDIFEMEDPDGSVETDAGYHSQLTVSSKPMKHREADCLDAMMDLTLSYIKDICYRNGTLDWEAAKTLYRELLLVFERIILPAHDSCHVQFIMFYMCRIKPAIYEGFLDYLWKKVQDPNTEVVFRQTAAAYIGSLLSRGSFVSLSTVMACVSLLCSWVHKYLDQTADDSVLALMSHHATFYTVCQTVFYIIIFRNKEIFETRKGYKWTESLNLQRIVTCRLNPLRVCQSVIVKTFASISRMHQLAFCDTIIEKNKRNFLPVSGGKGAQTLDNYVFPFDPYILHRSGKFVIPLYREYQDSLIEEDEKISDDDEDDFITDDIASPTDAVPVMSLGKTPTDFMHYGTSPGFLHHIND